MIPMIGGHLKCRQMVVVAPMKIVKDDYAVVEDCGCYDGVNTDRSRHTGQIDRRPNVIFSTFFRPKRNMNDRV